MSPPEPRAQTPSTTSPSATMIAIWRTRPARRQSDRKIAGVAGAIARRYDIDPVLVRIGLVVAAFYGVGILLYLAAWVALPPDLNDRPRGPLAGKGSSAHPVVLVAAVVACIAGAGSLMSGNPGVLVGLAVAGALLYLLHQSRSERGLASAAPTAAAGATAGGQAAGPATATATATAGDASPGDTIGVAERLTGAATEPGRPDPPAWDPLGAAPFAWDLPEPGPPPESSPPPARRRSRITLATLGLALVAGGVTAAIALPLAGVDGPRLVVGVMLAVVGLGLLLGALRHGGRGLIVAAIPLLLLGYGVTHAPMGVRWKGVGDLHAAPTSLAQLRPDYERTLGSITLDLRKLDLSETPTPPTPPTPAGPAAPAAPAVVAIPPGAAPPAAGGTVPLPGQPARTVVRLEVGDITVLVPPNADVHVHCRAEMGDVNCLGDHGETDGPTQDVTVDNPGADGVASGRPLELELLVKTGDVEVRRG